MTAATTLPGARGAPRTRRWAVLLVLTAAATWLWAHEGHAPLPTRGAAVDAKTGQVNLSADARAALDVRTAEAILQNLDETRSAPVVLVAPWQRRAFVTPRLAGKVASVAVRSGDAVESGQVLAEIESVELENLRMELLTASNAAELAARNVEQLTVAVRDGGVPEITLLEERTKLQQQRHAVAIARLKLRAVGLDEA